MLNERASLGVGETLLYSCENVITEVPMAGKSWIDRFNWAFFPLESIFESTVSIILDREYPLPSLGFIMSFIGTIMIIVGEFIVYRGVTSCEVPMPLFEWGTYLILMSFVVFIPALFYIIFVKGFSTTRQGFTLTILQPMVSIVLFFLCAIVTEADIFICSL